MSIRLFSSFTVLAGFVFVAACSAGGNSGGNLGGGGSGGGHLTSGSSTSNGGGGGLNATGGGGPGCATHCSSDLHQVLDCHDNVTKTCPASLACGKGGCVTPCEGAKDNASTFGCDFYSVAPAPESETTGSCFAVLIANTWSTPITVTADYGGTPLDIAGMARTPMGSGSTLTYAPLPNGKLDPNTIAILFLSEGPGGQIFHVSCPAGVTPGLTTDAAVNGTGYGKAFHVTTDAPVAAYDIYPYGGAASFVTSATLLVPTPAWGKNYIAADGYVEDPNLAFVGGMPFVQIVASVDNTGVTINPTTAIVGGGGVPPTAQGAQQTYVLNRGQVLQLEQDAELAGSAIASNHPVSVWGGSGCMNIPIGSGACDSAHQQLLPVSALGHDYVAVRYRDRAPGANEIVPWTLVGAVDGTTLTYDPAPPAGAPPTLGSGEMVRFSTTDAFSVKSQDAKHPFYVSGHMTGALAANPNPNTDGDPEYVSVIPPQQWLPDYLFLTDPTYKNTHLVFIRKKNKAGTFDDVSLDCVGTLSGWAPVGVGGDYEFARVDLVVGGVAQGSCENGVHTAKSKTPFGLTVWGWDVTVSYAYPAGMSTQAINTVVVPPTPK